MTSSLDPVFDQAGQEWNVDPDLLRAIAGQESRGNDRAVSPAGAQGRMQIMPQTQRDLGMTDPHDPVQSIYGGAKYLSQALDAEKTPEDALRYYHGGPNWRAKYGDESRNYVPGVAGHYQAIQAARKQDGGAALPKAAQSPAPDGGADDDEARGKALIEKLAAPAQAQAPSSKAAPAAANDDDEARGKALIERMTAPAPGPATPAQEATAADAPQMMKTAGWSGVPGELGGAAAKVWNLLTPPLPSPNKPANFEFPSLAPNEGSDTPGTPGPSGTIGFAGLRNALADPTGYTPSGVFPFAVKNDPTGQPDPSLGVRPDIGPLRPLARGVLDLFEGPTTGTVTPEASMALFNLLAGGAYPSVARGTGRAIAETGAYGAPLEDLYSRNRPPAAPDPANRLIVGPDGAPVPSPGMGAPQPQFLDAKWLHGQASDAAGRYNMGAGDAAVTGTVDAALKRGETVTLVTDGGAKQVPITSITNGMMTDAKGQTWGSAGIAADATGKEGVQIAPQPRAAGAAGTPYTQSQMTPAEIAANRQVAEKEWLNRTNQPGVADHRELVEGVNPTLAQREQTVQTAREQKLLSGQSAEVSQEERALADEHNLKRAAHYKSPDLAGSDVLLGNGKKTAKDKLDAGLDEAFANKTAANAQPVVAVADKMLSGRSGKRAAIESEVKGVRARLYDADGKLETDPEILYGVREHINDVLSKENQRQNPVSGRAQSELIKLRDALDGVIDPAAPGFTAAIKGYAADMKPLDVMEALQERENGLHDSQGRMQFSKVHTLMRDIIDARKPGAALSPFQHISDEQMIKLQNLHDDLKRVASAEDLARARGSDTAQNMWDAAKAAVKGRGAALVGMTPVVGKAVRGAQEFYAPFAEAKAQRNALKRGMEMLHPDPAKYPTHNRLDDH